MRNQACGLSSILKIRLVPSWLLIMNQVYAHIDVGNGEGSSEIGVLLDLDEQHRGNSHKENLLETTGREKI